MMKWLFMIVTVAVTIVMFVPVTRNAILFAAWRVSTKVQCTQGFIAVDEVRIHYKSFGSGSPIVLLHGGLSSSWDWLSEIPALAATHRVIVVDLRGHGSSTVGNLQFTYQLLASDVVAVLDSLAIEAADVAGWSDGGNVGLLMALDYPKRVRRLIAISANYHPSGMSENFAAQLSDNPTVAGSWLGRIMYQFQSSAPDQWPRLQKQVTNMWQSYPRLGPEDLHRISAPTLVVIGENDFIEREHSKLMAAAIPNADLSVLPGIGHAVTRAAPSLLLEKMDQFLSRSD